MYDDLSGDVRIGCVRFAGGEVQNADRPEEKGAKPDMLVSKVGLGRCAKSLSLPRSEVDGVTRYC